MQLPNTGITLNVLMGCTGGSIFKEDLLYPFMPSFDLYVLGLPLTISDN